MHAVRCNRPRPTSRLGCRAANEDLLSQHRAQDFVCCDVVLAAPTDLIFRDQQRKTGRKGLCALPLLFGFDIFICRQIKPRILTNCTSLAITQMSNASTSLRYASAWLRPGQRPICVAVIFQAPEPAEPSVGTAKPSLLHEPRSG